MTICVVAFCIALRVTSSRSDAKPVQPEGGRFDAITYEEWVQSRLEEDPALRDPTAEVVGWLNEYTFNEGESLVFDCTIHNEALYEAFLYGGQKEVFISLPRAHGKQAAAELYDRAVAYWARRERSLSRRSSAAHLGGRSSVRNGRLRRVRGDCEEA